MPRFGRCVGTTADFPPSRAVPPAPIVIPTCRGASPAKEAVMRTTMAVALPLAALLWAGPARAELPTGPVGRLSGDLAIIGEDGVKQAVVEATQTYAAETRSGTARIEIKQAGAKLAEASARLI